MKGVSIQGLARKPLVRICAACSALLALALIAMLVAPSLEGGSGGQAGSNSGTLKDGTGNLTTDPSQTPKSVLAPEQVAYLKDLLDSLPKPGGLNVEVGPDSSQADVYAVYTASMPSDELLDFYARELGSLGWQQETPFASVVPRITLEQGAPTYSKFVKDDLAIIVGATPNPRTPASPSRFLIDISPRGGANPPADLMEVFNSLPAPDGLTVNEPPRTTGINLQAFFWAKDEPQDVVGFYDTQLPMQGWQPEVASAEDQGSIHSRFVNDDLRLIVSASRNDKAPQYGAAHFLIDIRPKNEPY